MGALRAEEKLAIKDVRFWSLGEVTRVAIEANGAFRYHHDRIANPDRVFFDFLGARNDTIVKGVRVIEVGDTLLRRIRVAETLPAVTRVVLDLNGSVEFHASQLANPDRLMIELRPATSLPAPMIPQVDEAPPKALPLGDPPDGATIPAPAVITKLETPAKPPAEVAKPAAPMVIASPPKPAQRNRTGSRSLTRVLGLKLGRIVLDPGHGGHDHGSTGSSGLTEKELVLDIAKRLGALIEERMGSEVVFTRTDDVFIPLEDRTAFANEKKADLFLSIHANSSSIRSAAGPETFYLNFTTSRADLEVAARENAGSRKSIHELGDLIEKIALKDKVEESRDFAAAVQKSLHRLSGSRNRGVKKAPFIVLIGAAMPSVLAEVGFLSNGREENAMKRSEYRQRVAEALFKGVSEYAGTLSQFQVAQSSTP